MYREFTSFVFIIYYLLGSFYVVLYKSVFISNYQSYIQIISKIYPNLDPFYCKLDIYG